MEKVHTAKDALEKTKAETFDIILLDIMLPDTDGISLCAQLRRHVYCPIIFISCRDDDESIMEALNMGGDSYLTKPFRSPVLLAHIEANLRRMQQSHIQEISSITIGELTLDIADHTVMKQEEKIYLSPTEYELLKYMMMNKGNALNAEELYQHIWYKPSNGDVRTVFVHIRNLRKKIEEDASRPEYIITVRKTGYMFANR